MHNTTLPSNKKDALNKGVKQFYTGRKCKYGHRAPRYTTNQVCTECQSLQHKIWVRTNPEKQRKLNIRNKHSRRRMNSLRHSAVKRHATPKWADRNELRRMHEEGVRLSEETGVVHHIHHRVPLNEDKNVCGLNVPANLFILTEAEHRWYHSKKERLQLLY